MALIVLSFVPFQSSLTVKLLNWFSCYKRCVTEPAETGYKRKREILRCFMGSAVAQLVEWLLPIRDIRGLTPVIGKGFFKKMGQPRPLFHFFLVFSNKHHYNFYNKSMRKNFHPVYSAGIRTHNLLYMSHHP